MLCVFRVYGDNFQPEHYKAFFEGKQFFSYRKGDPVGKSGTKKHETSGFVCDITKENESDFELQVEESIHFLKSSNLVLEALRKDEQVEMRVLDFGYESRLGENVAIQYDFLPPELLLLCGQFNIGIELSLYSSFF